MKGYFEKPNWIATLCISVLLALVGLAIVAPKARAAVVCDVELSAGVGVADNQLSEGGSKIDLAQKGAMGGIGLGCSAVGKESLAGLMVRYSAMHLSGKLEDASLTSDGLFEFAGKVGYRFTEKSSVYLLAGWAWTKLDVKAADFSKSPSGPMAGIGMEHRIGDTPWSFRTEYAYHHFQGESIMGAKIEPDLHVARVAVVYSFGELPGFEDAKPAAKKKLAP